MSEQAPVCDRPDDLANYRYDAFISYRHVDPDRMWAKWLHQAIETYRVPGALSNQPGLTPLIRRVFRDEEELPVSPNLSREIDEALEQSRFLIVICSPKTPESRWCCAEIERFRAMGRDNRILALLVEGEPHQSFPRPLRQITRTVTLADGTQRLEVQDVEPLAADVRVSRTESQRSLKRAARLRFIACILGCRYDDLRQREQIRQNRRKTLAVGVMAILLAVMTSLAVIAVIQADRARKAQNVAMHQRDVALETLNALIVEAYDKLNDRPGGRQLQDSLLELALGKLEEVNLDIGSDGGRADLNAAVGMRRRGNLFLLAGRTEAAHDLAVQSLKILEELAGPSPDDPNTAAELARTSHLLGQLAERQGDIREAQACYARALALREGLITVEGGDAIVLQELGESYEYIGDVTADMGDTQGAAGRYEQSLSVRQKLIDGRGDQAQARRELATAHSKLGDVRRQLGNLSEAKVHYEQSMQLFSELAEGDAYNTRAQRDLAVAFNKLGSISQLMNRFSEAREFYDKSMAVTEALAASDRGNMQWQRELALCHSNLGFVNLRLNQTQAALDEYKRSLEIASELARADPADLQLQRGLADAHQLLGDARRQINEYPQALRNYESSLEIRRRLAQTDVQNQQLQRDLSIALGLMGQLNQQAGRTIDARRYFEEMLELRKRLAASDPANAQLQRDLSIGYLLAAMVSSGESKIEALRQAVAIRRKLVELDRDQSASRQDLGTALHLLGGSEAEAGQHEAAREALGEAVALFRALGEAMPGDARAMQRLAVSLGSLVGVEHAAGNLRSAIEAQQELCRVRQRISEASPEEVEAYLSWVMAQAGCGELLRADGQITEAQGAYRAALKLVEGLSPEGPIAAVRQQWIEQIQKRIAEQSEATGPGL